jgi:S-disulfanyl-L-cysteine oxidoreductase SoxD
MSKWLAVAGALLLCTAAAAQEDRRTIWDGVFTDAQAARGQQQYAAACARCHSEDLLGHQDAPALAGTAFLGRFDGSTVDDMVQVVRRTMPQEAPNSLSTETYVEIVAYVLKANGSPAGPSELATDRAALKQIAITAKEAR